MMERPDAIRILCVDDHPVVREGLRSFLERQGDMKVVGEASTVVDAVCKFRVLIPDITLLDLNLSGASGTTAVKSIRRDFPNARFIVLTTYITEQHVKDALEAGVNGYLLKESLRTELVDAVRTVHRGLRCLPANIVSRVNPEARRERITPREREVIALMVRGLRNWQVADHLSIAEETVKVHVKSILGKLGAEDRTQAVLVAPRRGLASLE